MMMYHVMVLVHVLKQLVEIPSVIVRTILSLEISVNTTVSTLKIVLDMARALMLELVM